MSTPVVDLEKTFEELRKAWNERLKDFAVFTLDINGYIRSWNSGAERTKGYRVEEIIGKHFSCLYTEEDRRAGKPEENLKKAAANGQITIEGWRVKKDGSKFWAELIITALHDQNGNPQGFIKVTRDATNRKTAEDAEDALRISEWYYRNLFAENPSMIFILNSKLTTLSVTPLGAGFLGYTPAELVGQSMLVLVHSDDRPTVAEQLRWCLNYPNQVHRLQFNTVRKDGSRIWVLEIAQGVYDTHGALTILVVCQDISDLKLADEETRKLNADLVARTAELEVSNKELETFNYTVAHDLRQPLNVLSMVCQKLKIAEDLPEESQVDVETIYQTTLRMDNFVRTLLEFSRMGYVEPLRTEVDLSQMAHEVVTELAQTEPERQVVFRIADALLSYADPSLLRAVLENLLGNAWKYTREQEGVVIEFGVAEVDGEPAYFVRDNGSGFEKDDTDRLFVPFHRLPGAEKATGFGIGLATVERIIRRHGGRVWAKSELGKGATIYFTLSKQA